MKNYGENKWNISGDDPIEAIFHMYSSHLSSRTTSPSTTSTNVSHTYVHVEVGKTELTQSLKGVR